MTLITVGVILVLFISSYMTDVVFGYKQGYFPKKPSTNILHVDNDVLESSQTPFPPIPSVTPSLIFTQTPMAVPTPTETITSTLQRVSINNLPESMELQGFIGHQQYYTLDCEARSALDWAGFLGYSIDELDFLNKLPKSDNPEAGFVGNYWDFPGSIPPYSYGVHAEPIAFLLREYGVPALAVKNMSWEELQLQIANEKPVVTWVIYQLGYSDPVTYTSQDGVSTIVAPYEHTVVVVGYQPGYVILFDGAQKYSVPLDQFLTSWQVLGNMAITTDF